MRTTLGDERLEELQDTLRNYETATGAQINPDKSYGLWIGTNKYRQDEPLVGYNWSSLDIKILGIHFGSQAAVEINFETLTEKYVKTLTLWQHRKLSLKGRTSIINQLAMSKLVYTAHIFPCTKAIIERITKETLLFIAGGERTRIESHVLYIPVVVGGLGLHDFN